MQRLGLPAALIVVLSLGWAETARARSLDYSWRQVLGVPVHVITADLNDPGLKISVATAAGLPHGAEPFHRIIGHEAPSAAVTGTYFSKATLRPVGDIVADGQPRHFGGLGTALAITPYNTVEIRTVPYGRHQDWRAFETVLGAGPRLLRHGQVAIQARAEGFADPHVLGRARRTAAGITAGNRLLLVVTKRALTLTELAKVMQDLGCRDALALDGGASTSMYYRGWTVVAPERPLTNLLIVHEDVPLLARARTYMSPEARKAHRSWRFEKAAQHYAAGRRLQAGGQLDRAVQHYSAAAELSGTNASYFQALGDALEQAHRPEAAARAYAWAGSSLANKGLHAAAVEALAHSLALNGSQDDVRERLLQTYQTMVRLAGGETASHWTAAGYARRSGVAYGWRAPGLAPFLRRRLPMVMLPPGTGLAQVAAFARRPPDSPSGGWVVVRDGPRGREYVLDRQSWLLLLTLTVLDLQYVHASDDVRPVLVRSGR